MREGDWASAALIALAVLLILACTRLRIDAADVAGAWASERTGRMYQIEAAGARAFRLRGPGGEKSAPASGPADVKGRVAGARSLRAGKRRGRLSVTGRSITWRGGDHWTRQGVSGCRHCL